MRNSQKFKLKLSINKISCILTTLLLIYLLIKYIIFEMIPFFPKIVIFIISAFLILSIGICAIYYIVSLNKLVKANQDEVLYELDNEIEKVFESYGLYITKNYIICIGSKFSLFKMFVIPIKNIDAIDTHNDSRYFYKKKGKKSKNGFLSFIKASIKTDIMYGDNDRAVFNVICGKKVYCITTSSRLNKAKMKKINEMADYICDRYKNIDYI